MSKIELVKSKVVFDELSHTYDFLLAKLAILYLVVAMRTNSENSSSPFVNMTRILESL